MLVVLFIPFHPLHLLMFNFFRCGHCKKAKPEMTEAAAAYHDDPKVEFAAVDCTIDRSVCSGKNTVAI